MAELRHLPRPSFAWWNHFAGPQRRGYLGSPYFKIVTEGTSRALAAIAGQDVFAVPEFTGAPEQLWRIDQLTDGTHRLMPKQVPGTNAPLVLTAAAASTPMPSKFDPKSETSNWNLRKP